MCLILSWLQRWQKLVFGHLIFLFCATARLDLFAWCVRLSRLSVGFWTHFLSTKFHFKAVRALWYIVYSGALNLWVQIDGLVDIKCTRLASGISGFSCWDVLTGWPYVLILYRRSLKFEISDAMAGIRRVCSLLLSYAEFKLPCMPFEEDVINFNEFSRQLVIICPVH